MNVDPASIPQTGPLVVFDGVCNLCNGSVQFVLRNESSHDLSFTSMQSQTGQALLRRNNLPLDDFDSFLFIENGSMYTKSRAAFRVLRYLKPRWRWLRIFAVLPRGLTDFFYDRIARNRYRLFGRRATCMVPPPGVARRFLP